MGGRLDDSVGSTGRREEVPMITRWRLWTRPLPGVLFVLGVELLAAAASVFALLTHPITMPELTNFAVIVAAGILVAEASRQVERMRRRFSDTLHVNLSSVWQLAAALSTAPSLAIATTTILYGHLWLRSWRRISGMHAYRTMFSGSNAALSTLAAATVGSLVPGGILDIVRPANLLWVLLVVATYSVVNSGLAAIAITLLQGDRSLSGLLGSWQENSIEYATLCMGYLAATLLAWRPLLLVLIFLPLYVLHRSVLIRQLEHAATTDEKTGLLNATSWQTLAANELHRAERHDMDLGLLMIDLDHFKWVNDRHGHLVGDQVLRLVADAMREEVRDYDLCGRFGGEEFVVLLPDTGLDRAVDVGNRICARIREIRIESDGAPASPNGPRLSASIGVATFPSAGKELDEILLAADNAMFAAKDGGRDQVRAVIPSRSPERRSPSPAE
jgi:diguanylate cyclase (GGDEF)-like protein